MKPELSQKYLALKHQLKSQIQSQHQFKKCEGEDAPISSNPQQPSSSIGQTAELPQSGRLASSNFADILTDYEKIEI